jgi:chromosome segregation ATPase
VSFSKKHNLALELEYFITGIQCRPKDMRELFAGAGIKRGTPVYDVLLD